VAAAFNNRAACETLLFLGANPLLEDSYGQRPLDLTLDESIRELLLNKMARSQAPARLYQIEKLKARPGALVGKDEKTSGPTKKEAATKKSSKHITPGERDIMLSNPGALSATLSS